MKAGHPLLRKPKCLQHVNGKAYIGGDVTKWCCEDNQNLRFVGSVNPRSDSTSVKVLLIETQFPESITAKHTRTGGSFKSIVFCHYTLLLS